MTEYIQQIYSKFSSSNSNESGIRNLAKSELLQIGNHLTGILADKKVGVDPPQLVVCGTQSSGKSTLLNRIIEMDILPTGKTMVTRTPLNLQLINSDKNIAEFGDYIEGLWKVSKKIDLNTTEGNSSYITAIREEIEKQTQQKAGQSQGISHNPIVLKIYAPYLPNLSFIDLPGLTSVACIDKGQPHDIKDQLRKMIGSYIKSPRSIILLVMAARCDLEVDQAFDLVKEYDQTGERTIGVITKVDLMNSGTDIGNYLTETEISKSLQLKYGYFAVKNKGPEQSNMPLTTKQILEQESAYFKSHPIYSQMIQSERLGINNLVSHVSKILTDHIKNALPALLTEISQIDSNVEKSLQEIGSYIPEKEIEQSSLVHTLTANFCRNFISSLEDRGALFNYGRHIKDIFINYRQSIGKMTYNFTDDLIVQALTNCDGNHMLSLPSIEVLEYCLKKPQNPQDKTLNNAQHGPLNIFYQPSILCLERIAQLLTTMVDDLTKKTGLIRFPNLVNSIKKEMINNIFQTHQAKSVFQIKNLINIEENYIWTDDSKFMEELQKLYQTIKPNKIDTLTIRLLINSYFETVKKNITDRVPKEIMYHFITMIENDVYETLADKILKNGPINKLLEESPQIAEKRKKLTEQKQQINSIKNLLSNCK